nr:PGF-pre-PGF domain-containing protein [uncultured Methanoregula sp.]
MQHNPLTLRQLFILVLGVALITSIVSAADPALHPNLSNTKDPVLSAAAISSPDSPLSGQLMFSYGNSTPAWTLQTVSAGWRARLSSARIATPDSKQALLSTGGTKETRTGGNSTDPFAVIDEKLAPSEAAGLKSLIQNTLHAFSYNEATGDWYARNAANRITFTYTRDGTAKFSGGESAFGLTLLGIGRGDGVSPAGNGHVQAEGRQLNITRPDFTEWYRNNDAGVEQGITIANRPAGSGLLHVGFGLTGNNSLSLKDKKTLILIDASGTPSFEYTGLHAFSSDGRDLPASLATDGTTLSWVVDDTGAVYPVTIDPVVVSASKATATFTGGAGGDIGSFTGGDYFGTSVALNSSGGMALVGAVGNCTAADQAGAAYIFTMPAGGWSGTTSASAATATFTGIGKDDNFGTSVALNNTGGVALIGAPQPNAAGKTGAAYIFTMPAGGWSGTTSASAATATFTGIGDGDSFGNSVALNSKGSVALIGAYHNDATSEKANEGAAYIFTMPTGGWSGTTSASAANATFTGGSWQDQLGNSVALNSSGTMALIGAMNNKTAEMGGAGAAYIFTMPTGGWSGTTSASAANATFTGGARDEALGWSVALSSDGTRALIGADVNDTAGSDAGAAYIFEAPGGVWGGTTSASAANATFTGGASGDRFGYSVALSSDGTRALVGASYNDTADTDAGAAYIFTMPAGGWSGTTSASAATATFTGVGGYQGKDDPYGDILGWSVALNSSGAVALVGATYNQTAGYGAGAAYIFQPPYVPLTATGITTGAAGTAVVDGLKLNPTTTLTNVDLYLGTSNTQITGTKIKTGVASLPASVATTVDGVSLVGKTPGTYYIIACESGTTSILGATTSGVYTVTAAPSIDGVIGFRWNTSDPSPRLYQIDSNGAVIDHNGTWFNDHLPWSGMKTVVVNASNSTPVLYGTNNRGDGLDLTGTYGDVMVEIPKFYTCSTYSNGNFSYWISPTAQEALHYTVAPIFNQRGTGTEAGTAASYYYVGRYDANLVGGKLQSATDKSPNVDMTLGTARTYAENKGAGWGITNVWTLSALRQLFYTEMVTLDSQTAWTGSRGIVDTGGSTPSTSGADGIDAAIYSINATGSGTGVNGKTPVSYRGIENLWGNVWQFQDGFTATTTGSNVINATGLGLTGQATTFASPLGVNDNQSVGALPAEGWQMQLMNADAARPLFLPSSTGGSDATYVSDYYYAPRSESAASPNILQSGGYCDDGGKAGVGALAPSDIASYTYAVVGARLEFRRVLVPVVSFSSRNTSAATNTSSQGWAGVAPFSMVFNDTSTGTPISWVWSATNVTGNNVPFYINTTTVTLANISYEFKTAGNYTIKLNATNSLGSGTSTQVTWVNVSAAPVTPVASFSSTNTSVATNTTSQDWAGVAPFTMVFNDTSTNTPTSWKWGRNNLTVATWEQFSTTNNATQVFVAGNWSVNLTATNSAGSGMSGITWVNVSAAPVTPVASFSSTNTSAATNTTSQGWSGVAPFSMVFNDTSTNSPTAWKWGRNNLTVATWEQFSTTNNATQVFVAGNWSVNLTATNSAGSGISGITWVNVSAAPVTPVASFSSTNTSVATNTTSQGWSGVAPFSMVFNDTSTNSPTAWKWGRNNLTVATWEQFSTTNNATQVFVAGNWSVNLTATNSAGSGISGITWVNVSAAPVTPVASFNSRNTSVATNTTSQGWAGVAPFTMVFNDTSTNSPTAWKWGRNNLTVATWEQFSTTNNATQVFVAGNWSVNLTATNSAGSGISGITWVNVSTSPASPVAGFTGTPLSGTAPLAVTFTDTSTGTPTSWNWVFGDGNTSTIQSPVFTYVTSGYFTVKLTAANAFGSSAKTISQYIAVAAVSRQNSTENKNITQTISSGQTNVNVSTCDPGMTVTNTTTQVLVTNPALGWQKYTFEGANITKNTCYVNISVSNVTMDSTPFTAPLPGLGTVSTSLTIGQNQTTSGTLQQEIIPGANTTVTNAFQLAATNIGLTLGNIAYTLQIGGAAPFNRNLTSSGVIINMSASHSWVLANGGTGAIRIFRYSDTGAVQVLPTTFVGTDAGSIDYFRATSVNGFSEFGLGGTSTTPGPSGGGGWGGDSDGPVSMVTPQQVPGTTKVNVGGDSAVTQVAITGTGISGAIVTGTVVSGPGLNTEPPTRMVYEYVDITPARYTTISEAVISFTVPVTWLTERQLTPPNVVMYHLVGQTWVALPTTLVKVENGVAYYTAASPGFSRFAITGQAGVTSGTPLATLTPAGQTFGDLSPTTSGTKTPTPAAVTVRSVTKQTTAIPAASQPAPALPLPTMAIVGGIVVVLVAGGFLIRRWWIRRQNPALFRNYD